MTSLNIEAKIISIRQVLINNESKFVNMGISDGLLGVSLYHYYYYLYTNNETYLNDMIHYLEKSIDGINDSYNGTNIICDLIEFGDFLHFLNKKNILDEDINNLLVDTDEIIKNSLVKSIENNNLNPMFGAIKEGYYFINRLDFKDFNFEILNLLKCIDDQAIQDKSFAHWESTFKDSEKPITELGITHGVSGIINFLLLAYSKKIDYKNLKPLILKALNFLNKFNEKKGENWFKLEMSERGKLKYQNLAYGDLGIGYTFLNAGIILKNNDFFLQGTQIIENACRYRDSNRLYTKDASLFYGSSGLSALIKKMNKQMNNPILKESEEYWGNITLSMGDKKSPWAGYISHFNAHQDYTHLSFIEGICGIGIMLMVNELELDHDYLNFLNIY